MKMNDNIMYNDTHDNSLPQVREPPQSQLPFPTDLDEPQQKQQVVRFNSDLVYELGYNGHDNASQDDDEEEEYEKEVMENQVYVEPVENQVFEYQEQRNQIDDIPRQIEIPSPFKEDIPSTPFQQELELQPKRYELLYMKHFESLRKFEQKRKGQEESRFIRDAHDISFQPDLTLTREYNMNLHNRVTNSQMSVFSRLYSDAIRRQNKQKAQALIEQSQNNNVKSPAEKNEGGKSRGELNIIETQVGLYNRGVKQREEYWRKVSLLEQKMTPTFKPTLFSSPTSSPVKRKGHSS